MTLLPPHLRLWTPDGEGGPVVVELSGELDLVTAPGVSAVFAHLALAGVEEVVVDASRLSFVDGSGAQSLLACHQRVSSTGIMCLVPSSSLLRLLDLLGVRSGFAVFTSVEEALALLGATPPDIPPTDGNPER